MEENRFALFVSKQLLTVGYLVLPHTRNAQAAGSSSHIECLLANVNAIAFNYILLHCGMKLCWTTCLQCAGRSRSVECQHRVCSQIKKKKRLLIARGGHWIILRQKDDQMSETEEKWQIWPHITQERIGFKKMLPLTTKHVPQCHHYSDFDNQRWFNRAVTNHNRVVRKVFSSD